MEQRDGTDRPQGMSVYPHAWHVVPLVQRSVDPPLGRRLWERELKAERVVDQERWRPGLNLELVLVTLKSFAHDGDFGLMVQNSLRLLWLERWKVASHRVARWEWVDVHY